MPDRCNLVRLLDALIADTKISGIEWVAEKFNRHFQVNFSRERFGFDSKRQKRAFLLKLTLEGSKWEKQLKELEE